MFTPRIGDQATGGDIVGEGMVKWPSRAACAESKALQWYNVEEESGKFRPERHRKSFKNLTELLKSVPA